MTRAIRKHLGDFIALVILFVIAIVTMELDKKWPKKAPIHPDATALLRPRTGLKDMFVELDPGTNDSPAMQAGGTIPVQNTAPDINQDEILSALDTDTRAYLQLLINGAGKGLAGHGNDLNAVFKALSPTYRDLNRVSTAVASRRAALQQLIHEFGDLTNHVANKDKEIRTLVTASDAVFQAFASQNQNLSLAVARLPGALRQTQSTLTKVIPFANTLRPTLTALRPAFRQLNTTNHQIIPFAREAFPILCQRPLSRRYGQNTAAQSCQIQFVQLNHGLWLNYNEQLAQAP